MNSISNVGRTRCPRPMLNNDNDNSKKELGFLVFFRYLIFVCVCVCGRVTQVRSSNGQAVVRALRSVADNRAPSAGDASSVSSTSAKSADVATDDSGLPIVNCSMAAPWTTPPKKTYKQVRRYWNSLSEIQSNQCDLNE